MDKSEFVKSRIQSRDKLLKNVTEVFASMNPFSIHLFGSGVDGFKDEFSDIDIWITFNDVSIDNALKDIHNTFTRIAPYILKHHSKSWSPVGGASYSVIHEMGGDLLAVDYYISKLSETVINKEVVCIYGDDSVSRGVWRLNRNIDKELKDTHTLRKDIDLLLDLVFISFKGIVRKWESDEFINTLQSVYDSCVERYPARFKAQVLELNLSSIQGLLDHISSIANQRQKNAVKKLKRYALLIEDTYSI